LPKNLKAAAGPSPDPDGYDGEPDIEAVSIPAAPEVYIPPDFSRSSFEVSKYQDPLHILQEYVAEVSNML
jgi:hypothetical protein